MEIHAINLFGEQPGEPEYACYPAVGSIEAVPLPRSDHSACTVDDSLVVFGGRETPDSPLKEESCLWLWNSKTIEWSKLSFEDEYPKSRFGHNMFVLESQDLLLLHGGVDKEGPTTETWLFEFMTEKWTKLPSAPAVSLASQFVNNVLYTVSGESDLNGSVHFLKLDSLQSESDVLKWQTVDFPSSPLTPGPRPCLGSALVPVTTGYGRRYLLYLLGNRRESGTTSSNSSSRTSGEHQPFYSDMWSLQLPSDGITAASVKDAIRDNFAGIETGAFTWCKIEIEPSEVKRTLEDTHHGRRGFFGTAVVMEGRGIIIWGGVNSEGETEADGWLLKVT